MVLAGFFAALAPLCLATWFTLQTLDELALNGRETSRRAVEVKRLGQEIEGSLLQLERRAGQYYALADPNLAQLFNRERSALLQDLRTLQKRAGSELAVLSPLQELLARVELENAHSAVPESSEALSPQDFLETSFTPIRRDGQLLSSELDTAVDELLQRNARETETLIETLVFQLLMLAAAALALLLFFSYWITRPVRELTQEIHHLGTEGLGHRIEISGPQELRLLGSKLEWLRLRLQETEQREQRFLRHISHELKTPLSSLREGTDLLAERVAGPLSPGQQEVVDILRENSLELQRLIENLLDYNQLPRQALTFEEISLQALWEDLQSNYRISMQGKSLQLAIDSWVDTWVADLYKLRTAMDNLLSNAVNYTPIEGMIQVVWRERNGNLEVDVANSGEPIPPEDCENVFEPFFQSTAKRTGPIKGSGIGLSVARECMEVQGGSLNLVSHPTLPVCFRLTCPAH